VYARLHPSCGTSALEREVALLEEVVALVPEAVALVALLLGMEVEAVTLVVALLLGMEVEVLVPEREVRALVLRTATEALMPPIDTAPLP